MSDKFIFKVIDDWRYSGAERRLELAEIPVLKETAKTVYVKSERASGYRTQIPKQECHFTPEEAIIEQRLEVEKLETEARQRRSMLEALRRAVYGEGVSTLPITDGQ